MADLYTGHPAATGHQGIITLLCDYMLYDHIKVILSTLLCNYVRCDDILHTTDNYSIIELHKSHPASLFKGKQAEEQNAVQDVRVPVPMPSYV